LLLLLLLLLPLPPLLLPPLLLPLLLLLLPLLRAQPLPICRRPTKDGLVMLPR
jgi:hypothetical protein